MLIFVIILIFSIVLAVYKFVSKQKTGIASSFHKKIKKVTISRFFYLFSMYPFENNFIIQYPELIGNIKTKKEYNLTNTIIGKIKYGIVMSKTKIKTERLYKFGINESIIIKAKIISIQDLVLYDLYKRIIKNISHQKLPFHFVILYKSKFEKILVKDIGTYIDYNKLPYYDLCAINYLDIHNRIIKIDKDEKHHILNSLEWEMVKNKYVLTNLNEQIEYITDYENRVVIYLLKNNILAKWKYVLGKESVCIKNKNQLMIKSLTNGRIKFIYTNAKICNSNMEIIKCLEVKKDTSVSYFILSEDELSVNNYQDAEKMIDKICNSYEYIFNTKLFSSIPKLDYLFNEYLPRNIVKRYLIGGGNNKKDLINIILGARSRKIGITNISIALVSPYYLSEYYNYIKLHLIGLVKKDELIKFIKKPEFQFDFDVSVSSEFFHMLVHYKYENTPCLTFEKDNVQYFNLNCLSFDKSLGDNVTVIY